MTVKNKPGDSRDDDQLEITVEEKSLGMMETVFETSNKEVRQKDDDLKIITVKDKQGDSHDDDQLKIITVPCETREKFEESKKNQDSDGVTQRHTPDNFLL